MYRSIKTLILLLISALFFTISQAAAMASSVSGTEWNLYSEFTNPGSDIWSYWYVTPNNWTGTFTKTTMKTDSVWQDPADKGWIVWLDSNANTKFLPNTKGLFFMPGGTNDHIVAFKAPVSGKYTIS